MEALQVDVRSLLKPDDVGGFDHHNFIYTAKAHLGATTECVASGWKPSGKP